MGLLNKIARLGQRWLGDDRFDEAHRALRGPRLCRLEEMETRRLMAADLHVGSVYLEQAAGNDAKPNILQFTFEGGAPGTQLTRIVIDGDKDGKGLSSGDMFFDTAPGGLGAFNSNPLQIISHDGFQVVSTEVTDGGTQLVINLSGFDAGEKLVLSVDVDEAQFVDGDQIDVNAVAEGGEFQRSHFIASFVAPHYEDITTPTQFWDAFDQNFASADSASGSHLDLPNDQYSSTDDLSDLSAGAVAVAKQIPKPNSLSGVVYSDHNLNNHQDAGDEGIAGVSVALLVLNDGAFVPTGMTTVTDSQGAYKFDALGVGTYRVVETQPVGYFSVGATPGTVDGQVRGVVLTPDILDQIQLLGGDNSIRNDFAEAVPNSIRGHVGNDVKGDCETNPNTPGIAGVVMHLLDANGNVIRTTTTDANGNYVFDNLPAGNYAVLEEQPAGWLEDDAHAGSAGGVVVNDDKIAQIVLTTAIDGVHYDFCEVLPVSIAGHVGVDTTGDCNGQSDTPPIAGVVIHLLDDTGHVIGTTTTDANGNYIFANLAPGTYGVREEQPAGYFDDDEHAGSAGGDVSDDLITHIVLLSGVHAVDYNFCELLPVGISGHVGIDTTGDCDGRSDTPPIAGVVMQLTDASGHVVSTTVTDAQGNYRFDGLPPGTYGVHEVQPAGYFQGDEHAGSAGGDVSTDTITHVVLTSGVHATEYNFCELLPVSISGFVQVDTTGDCENTADAPPLSGVVMHLLDSGGHVIGTTTTDANGHYIFDQLPPGTYGVREEQPSGYFDGDEHAGSAGGDVSDDLITHIVLLSGVQAVHYDFCEVPPANLCGYVYSDLNNNAQKDAGEAGIGGVTLVLLDANGQPTGATAITDGSGLYCFMGLRAGTYGVHELQPPGYYDGLDTPGSAGGTAHNPGDLITDVVLMPGADADNYNFGELLPASISGFVHVDTTGDCENNPGTPGLAGVTIHLLDGNGNVVGTAITDANGHYSFDNLAPGTYGVREEQPDGYFDGDEHAGSAGGIVSNDLVTNIVLASGLHGVDYDFCEVPPASISGFVFQDGPPIEVEHAGDVPNVLALRDGKLTPDDTRLGGVLLELRDGVTGLPIYGSVALAGLYAADQPITTITDANGHYQFHGLPLGSYAVYDVKPAGYLSGIDTPGSLGGSVISPLVATNPAVLAQLLAPPHDDALVGIMLPRGGNSTDNNFSVVVTTVVTFQLLLLPPAQPEPLVAPGFFNPLPPILPPPDLVFPYLLQPQLTRAGGALYTWHLSVVDAGRPRGLEIEQQLVQLTSMRPDDEAMWSGDDLSGGEFLLPTGTAAANKLRRVRFGISRGTPITGDFNGDGKFEIGVFKDGKWYIDLNDNGVWDEGDLWARLGHKGDRPVTGDWDGDGKTDIGIYGPAWPGDPRAVAHEPGLPDPHNENTDVHKNVPREAHRTAVGRREMKLRGDAKSRADVIDHVFFYGMPGDHPIVGDWNGDGTHTIAVFRDGVWYRDIDGDGKWSKADEKAHFGRHGDLPVVGDFNGDGVDDLGVFRDGHWLIDTNGNGRVDPEDLVFELGGPGDLPIVGDWDGDGIAEGGVYREYAATAAQAPVGKAATK